MQKFMFALIAIACLQFGWEHFSGGGSFSNAPLSDADIFGLAAKTGAEDIVMYSATECRYCADAKSWMARHGFQFLECNMDIDDKCVSDFEHYGADGTPYLIVRGHHMKNGFDSDEFLAAISNYQ